MTTIETPELPRINVDGMRTSQKLRLHATEVLPNVREANFDMNVWATRDPSWDRLTGPACGSAACSFGSAAFRFEGLELVESGNSHAGGYEVRFDGLTGFEAAMEFFGITQREAWELFDPDYGIDERMNDPDNCNEDSEPFPRTLAEVIATTLELAQEYAARGE